MHIQLYIACVIYFQHLSTNEGTSYYTTRYHGIPDNHVYSIYFPDTGFEHTTSEFVGECANQLTMERCAPTNFYIYLYFVFSLPIYLYKKYYVMANKIEIFVGISQPFIV